MTSYNLSGKIAPLGGAHGGIDILLSNVAVGSATVASFDGDVGEQDSLMLVINADGTLKMCQDFMAASDGPGRKLINISSVGGRNGP